MDFTLKKYSQLLYVLKSCGYKFITFEQYCRGERFDKMAIIRHDVDLKPQNSLQTAIIETKLGIVASYYFRVIEESWSDGIIKKISLLDHEIGYHYESLTTTNGNIDKAYADFCVNLRKLRELVAVNTICMHGSPKSKWDSKDIWRNYSYKDLGIIGEPYLDTDFSKLFYLTDTGRMWDGYKVSVRDRIEKYQDEWIAKGMIYHSTDDIIQAVRNGKLSTQLMITTHPQRWTDDKLLNIKEYFIQNIKNIVKSIIIKLK